jgi:hypothetical protein
MDEQFESFLNDLAGELKKAAECPVWEIPMNHRTKDSISAFRASAGMLSAIVLDLMKKHRAPADSPVEPIVEPPVETPVVEAPANPMDELLATDGERLFDSDADKPRRRRSTGA